ncbi:MAG: hypothetical protein RQ750_13615 [Roseovarius sp.]|nr:hypothetical protein [Roseovarius sp.]
MPLNHALIICFGFIFGGIVASFLKAQGLLDYAFFVRTVPGRHELNFAIVQAVVFCSTVMISRRFLGDIEVHKDEYLHSLAARASNYRLVALSALLIYAFLITIYYWEEMMADIVVRHSGNHNVSRFTLLLVLAGSYVSNGGKYLQRLFAFSVLIYMGTIASSAGASRAVAIPFILAGFSFVNRRNYLTGTVLLYLALVALTTAFQTRGAPSYYNFWSSLLTNAYEFDVIRFVLVSLQYSFPGLTTIQAAMFLPGTLSIDAFGRFLAYLLPIPSSLLPSSLFEGLSLSYALGIDRSTLGINYDILSEGIFWFGVGGAWIFTLAAGLLTVLPYYVATRVLKSSSNSIYVLCLMANVWMVYGGMVFALRSGSRAVLALTLLMLLYSFVRRFRIRPKRTRLYQ